METLKIHEDDNLDADRASDEDNTMAQMIEKPYASRSTEQLRADILANIVVVEPVDIYGSTYFVH